MMQDNSSSEWNDLVFIPPGYDIGTGFAGNKSDRLR